jgi:hypothetical protein
MRVVVIAGMGMVVLVAAVTAACDSGADGATNIDGGVDGASTPAPIDPSTPSDASIPDGSNPPDSSDADASTCPVGAVCAGTYNYAFVTSTTELPSLLGGVAGADALCNQRAQGAGLPGQYVAWISSTTSDARMRLGSASGWLRTDRRPFAASVASLFAGKALYPLKLDENGNEVAEETVATGTLGDGTVAASNCSDWTLFGPSDRLTSGYPWMATDRWSVGGLGYCNEPTRLYCFGKDHDAPIPSMLVQGRKAFVTKQRFDPSMGIAAADTLCQSEGAALPGTYKALLATTTASAISRFSTSGPTWVRTDGIALWAFAADAAANASILAPILLPADGSPPLPGWVWIGASALDAPGTDTCADWTSNASTSTGGTGQVNESGNWTDTNVACNSYEASYVRLACLQE